MDDKYELMIGRGNTGIIAVLLEIDGNTGSKSVFDAISLDQVLNDHSKDDPVRSAAALAMEYFAMWEPEIIAPDAVDVSEAKNDLDRLEKIIDFMTGPYNRMNEDPGALILYIAHEHRDFILDGGSPRQADKFGRLLRRLLLMAPERSFESKMKKLVAEATAVRGA